MYCILETLEHHRLCVKYSVRDLIFDVINYVLQDAI